MKYDIAIIGGGPGGYVAAIRASQLGARVALIEKEKLGGTCLNHGCIPTKAMVASANLYDRLQEAAEFGINVERSTINYKKIIERKNRIVQQLTQGIGYLMKKNKIDVCYGTGRLSGCNTVRIFSAGEERSIEAANIIIATGSKPFVPEAFGYDGEKVVTSTELLASKELPGSLIIAGGGVIGCEFASIFHSLGVEVTLVEMLPHLIANCDGEISHQLAGVFKKRGIKTLLGVKIEKVTPGKGVTVQLSNGEELKAEKMLVSIGRVPESCGLGLENAGVELGRRGEILVNELMETNIPGIYAIGDVTDQINLAHAASAQGALITENILEGKKTAFTRERVPGGIFTFPEIAYCGKTEEELKQQGAQFRVGRFPFMANGKALCEGESQGFVKILANAETEKILGVHIIGPHACDLIGEGLLAVKMGASIEDISQTIHIHPTLGEAFLEAVEGVRGRAVHI